MSLDHLTALVAVGSRVELELCDEFGGVETNTLEIVPDSAADFAAGFLGAGTPLARAIMGRPAGAVVPYRQADIATVRILAITAAALAPRPAAAADRAAATQEAVERANLQDAIQLALTVNVKWGDYSPEALEPDAPAGANAIPKPPD